MRIPFAAHFERGLFCSLSLCRSVCFGRRLNVVGFGFLLSSCRLHVFIRIAFYMSILTNADADADAEADVDPAFLALGHSVWCLVCVCLYACVFLVRTCCILLLDFTLFSYTFAASHITLCIIFGVNVILRVALAAASVAANAVNRFRSCFRLLLLLLLVLCTSRIFAVSLQLLRLCSDRYHDVISRCILE